MRKIFMVISGSRMRITLLCVGALLLFLIPLLLNGGRFYATDQEMFIKTSESLQNYGSWVIPAPLNSRFDSPLIDSYNVKYVSRHGGLVQIYPPLATLVLCMADILTPGGYGVAACLIGMLCVFLFFRYLVLLGYRNEALITAILFATTPIFAFYTPWAMSETVSFGILLSVLYAVRKGKAVPTVRNAVITGILTGLLVWTKYANAVLLVVFFIYSAISVYRTRMYRFHLVQWLACGGVMGLLLVYNRWAFGGWFVTGINYSELKQWGAAQSDAVALTMSFVRRVGVKDILVKVSCMPVYIAMCAPAVFIGITGLLNRGGKPPRDLILPQAAGLAVLGFYVILVRGTFGSEHYHRSLFSSFQRYAMPWYCLCLLLVPEALKRFSVWGRRLCLLLFGAANILMLWFAPVNISNWYWELHHQAEKRNRLETVKAHTEEGAVVIGSHVISYLPNSGRHIISAEPGYLSRKDFTDELHRVSLEMVRENHPVYLIDDYHPALEIPGLRKEPVTVVPPLFRLLPAADVRDGAE